MEQICKSDYQDVYRIKDGVLLVINKFKRMTINGKIAFVGYIGQTKNYAKGCKGLSVLKADFYYGYLNTTFRAGQVLYDGYPVELTDSKEWTYQIKTTGDSFSGNLEEMSWLIAQITKLFNY